MTWVSTDGEHLLINTEVHRQKFRNVQRDPRVTVMIRDENDPCEHTDELAHKYNGGPCKNPIQSERVMLQIAPVRQYIFA